MRLYQAELLMEVKAAGQYPAPRLNEWIRGYAINAAKDKVTQAFTLQEYRQRPLSLYTVRRLTRLSKQVLQESLAFLYVHSSLPYLVKNTESLTAAPVRKYIAPLCGHSTWSVRLWSESMYRSPDRRQLCLRVSDNPSRQRINCFCSCTWTGTAAMRSRRSAAVSCAWAFPTPWRMLWTKSWLWMWCSKYQTTPK